ncbi:MAG: hypothetical protein ACM3XM_17020, partial [Mycobacterium leprae]
LAFLLLAYLQRHPTKFTSAEMLRSFSLMPLVVTFFWPIWRAWANWKSEWRGKHVHLVFMLPVPSWWLVLSKTIALVVETTVCAIVAVAGFLVINWENMRVPSHGWGLLTDEPLPLLMFFSLAFCLAVLAQFAALAGRLVSRFGGWLSAVALLTGGWAFIRFSGFAASLLGWIPPWPVIECRAPSAWDSCSWVWVLYRTPTVVGALLGAVLLLWLSAWLIERHLEA